MTEPIQSHSPNQSTFDPSNDVCSVPTNPSNPVAPSGAPPSAGTAQLLSSYDGSSAAFVQAQEPSCGEQVRDAINQCSMAAGASAGGFLAASTPMTAPLAFAVGLGIGAQIAVCVDAVADAAEACGGGS